MPIPNILEMSVIFNQLRRLIAQKIFVTDTDTILDCVCGLVVRVLGYRSRDPGSISGATRFSE
jgi:hypothetical protein